MELSELMGAMPQIFDLNTNPVSRAYNEPAMNEADRLMVLTSAMPAMGKSSVTEQVKVRGIDGMDDFNRRMGALSVSAQGLLDDMAYQSVRDALVIRAFNDERDTLSDDS